MHVFDAASNLFRSNVSEAPLLVTFALGALLLLFLIYKVGCASTVASWSNLTLYATQENSLFTRPEPDVAYISPSLNQYLKADQIVRDSKPFPPHFNARAGSRSAEQDDFFDLIIVGAGVVGGALGAYIGRENAKNAARNSSSSSIPLRVLVLERDLSEPQRIVGELLQPRGVNILNEMGLDGNAVPYQI